MLEARCSVLPDVRHCETAKPRTFQQVAGSAVFSDWFVIGLTEEDWRGLCQFERSYCKTGSASNGREPMASLWQ